MKRLSQAEHVERRRLGLCYNCDEKYTRGHNRTCRRLFFIDGVELSDADDAAGAIDQDTEAPVFSLQALVGVPVAETMQIAVALGPTSLVALLDSGSTHNFISETAAQRFSLPLHQRPRLTAMVTNGERVTWAGVIKATPLFIDGAPFPADLFVMSLAGYDVVLGALGPIIWDLANHRMTFQHQGRTVCWSSVPTPCPPTLSATTASEPLLDGLLATFEDIFVEPTGLPPKRAHDHRIILKPDAQPVVVRPYRYPAAHKDELERKCRHDRARHRPSRRLSVLVAGHPRQEARRLLALLCRLSRLECTHRQGRVPHSNGRRATR
jgi:hypothetical protein